ncbi:MAG: hypothetical protein V4590_07920 [Bacteroidota bacterium]
MTNESAQTKTDYVWQPLAMLESGYYPAAICLTKSNQLFAATWNPVAKTGYLQRWSVSQSKWLPVVGLYFKSQINQMCCDTLGNIYLVGDTNALGNYVISIYNATNGWSFVDNGYKVPINYICCDTNNNVYVTGNFIDTNNNFSVMQYNLGQNKWTQLTGSGFNQPLSGLCLNPSNTLFALEVALNQEVSISYWNGQKWFSFTSPNMQTATGIGCDNSGNVFFNSSSSIWSYNLLLKQYTDLKAPIQTFSGTVVFTNFFYIDNILYFSISGYTDTGATACYVWVYSNNTWTDITPSNINENNNAVIYDIACYTGKSHNIILGTNLNKAYDGKQLIH